MDPTVPPNYMQYAMSRESGGDPNAQNPLSSASGLFQFTDGTSDDVRRKHPELGLTPGWHKDPNQAPIGMQAFTNDNAKILSDNNVPVTNNSLYLAHRFGAEGALKALNADVNAPVSSVFGDAVMKANPDLRNKKIGDLTGAVGKTPMADNTPILSANSVAGGPSTLFGGNPTPVGAVGALARLIGIGTEDNLGRHLQNAGAGLIAAGGKPEAAAELQNAANRPLFMQRFTTGRDALGRTFMVDTHTGQMSYPGAAPSDGEPQTLQNQLAQTPVALAKRAEADQEASAEKMKSLEDAAAQAQGIIDQNNEAMALSKDPSTIQGPGLWNMFRQKLSENTNGSLGGMDLSKQAALEKINSNLVGSMLSAQKGVRFAAPEIKFGETASADTEKPAAANQQIYSNNIQNARRVIAARDIARKYMAKYSVLGSEYSKELQDYQNKNPVYQPTSVVPGEGRSGERKPLADILGK